MKLLGLPAHPDDFIFGRSGFFQLRLTSLALVLLVSFFNLLRLKLDHEVLQSHLTQDRLNCHFSIILALGFHSHMAVDLLFH